MKKTVNIANITKKEKSKKCGAITCINNIQGSCYSERCELYENVLIQED